MTFWIAAALAALAAALWVARPLLRVRAVEMDAADGTMSIYRDQLEEIARDRASGLISATECAAAEAEIERRALKAARRIDQGQSVSHRSLPLALPITGLVVALSLGGYSWLGEAGFGDRPLAKRQEQQRQRLAEAGDMTGRLQTLIDAVGENPDSFEDWWLLARSYSAVGDHASATDAYARAATLSGDRPAVLSAYAEAMTLANGNKVPQAAELIFAQLAARSNDPRARYYLALSKAQAQDFESAANDWAALARDSSPDAPWMPLVQRDIVNMARFLDRDVTEFLPDASPEMILRAGGSILPDLPGSRPDIETLEAAVATNPKDYEGWIALAEARAASEDMAGAAQALDDAEANLSKAPFLLQKFAEARRRLGLGTPASRRGPSATT